MGHSLYVLVQAVPELLESAYPRGRVPARRPADREHPIRPPRYTPARHLAPDRRRRDARVAPKAVAAFKAEAVVSEDAARVDPEPRPRGLASWTAGGPR